MRTLGFIQQTCDAVEMQRCIGALNSAGVPTESIQIESNLDELLKSITSGDTIYVCHISEMGDSIQQIFSAIGIIIEKGARICSLHDRWITDIDQKGLLPLIIKSIAELNREIISKQTKIGLKKARKNGKRLGRPSGKNKSGLF